MTTLRHDDVHSNIRSLSWFFPDLNGCEEAESLLGKRGSTGQYLLRTSSYQYSLSAKAHDSVKHFPVVVNGSSITFGIASFECFDAFLEHFKNQPFVSDNSGQLLLLRSPFIPHKHTTVFELVTVHGTLVDQSSVRFSRTGYLTKQGGKVKTWKERWFILDRNEFSYYEKVGSRCAKGKIDLRDCKGTRKFILPQVIPGKEFAFELTLPWRDYIMVSDNVKDRDDWVHVIEQTLQWIRSQR